MSRITVTLLRDEREALSTLAQRERRDPRAQAALIIRQELIDRGLLPSDIPQPITTSPAHSRQPQAAQR